MPQTNPILKQASSSSNSAGSTTTNVSAISPEMGVQLIEQLAKETETAKRKAKDANELSSILAPEILAHKKTQAEATAEVKQIDLKQALVLENDKRKLTKQAAIAPNLSKFTSELVEKAEDLSAAEQRYKELRAVTVEDAGIAGYFAAQMELSGASTDVDVAKEAVQSASTTISALRMANDDIHKVATDTAITITEGEIAKINEATKARIEAEQAQGEIDGSIAVAKSASDVVALTRAQIDAATRISTTVTNARAANRANAASLVEEQKWTELTRLANIHKKEVGDILVTEDTMRAAFAAGGQSAIDAGVWVNLGLKNQDPYGIDDAVGNDFNSSIANDMAANTGHKTLKLNNNTNKFIESVYNTAAVDFETVNGKGSFSKATAEQVGQAANQAKEKLEKEHRKHIEVGGGNLFSMPAWENMQMMEAIKENRLATEIITPSKFSGVNELGLLELTARSVVDGKFKIEEATNDLLAIMKAGRHMNIKSNHYNRRHIANPTKYPVTVKVNEGALEFGASDLVGGLAMLNVFSSGARKAFVPTMNVDMYDENSLKDYIVSYLSRETNVLNVTREAIPSSTLSRQIDLD